MPVISAFKSRVKENRRSRPSLASNCLCNWECSSVGRVPAEHTHSTGFSSQHLVKVVWQHMPVISTLGKWSQGDQWFKGFLGYIASSRPPTV